MKKQRNKRVFVIRSLIDGKEITVEQPRSILEIALRQGIYIPHLCYHPVLMPAVDEKPLDSVYQGERAFKSMSYTPYEGCGLCLVEIEGKGLFRSCSTVIQEGMVIHTSSEEVKERRREVLAGILENHPHDCLICEQAEGCDRKLCSKNIEEQNRCCWKFGACEFQKLVSFIGIDEKGLNPYMAKGLPLIDDNPLFTRNYDLCIGCLRCVRVCREVKGINALGFTFQDKELLVGSKKSTLLESGCQFCGACIEVCPTGALKDKDLKPGDRESALVPCRRDCPAGIDIPQYVRYLAEGKPDQALAVVKKRVPFPAVLGRICYHPCEVDCRRGRIDKAVSIRNLKRCAEEYRAEGQKLTFKEGVPSGKEVAVVGSGPAGITAAYFLARAGHLVTVFETLPLAGGMLRVGIPQFRLPKEVLDREIKESELAGVKIKTNSKIESAEELFSMGFNAIFLALGAHKGVRLGIPGEESEGVIDGIDFLAKVNLGEDMTLAGKVAVIGGGNVAADAARVALRLGADEVTIFYRRTEKEMPAFKKEVEAAIQEGVKIAYNAVPKSIKKENGRLMVEFLRTEMGEEDSTGRRQPVPIEGSDFGLNFAMVIRAIGQVSDIPKGFGKLSRDGDLLMVDKTTGATATKGIFAGGDSVTGPKTVIDAIASGRKGAISIDLYLGGKGEIEDKSAEQGIVNLRQDSDLDRLTRARAVMPLREGQKISDFSEVELGLGLTMAISEAERCLRCDLRLHIPGVIMPPEKWLSFDEESVIRVPEAEGVYQLFDKDKKLYKIVGTENLRKGLMEELGEGSETSYFIYEEDSMFTARERQLLQGYLKRCGHFPKGNEMDEELF